MSTRSPLNHGSGRHGTLHDKSTSPAPAQERRRHTHALSYTPARMRTAVLTRLRAGKGLEKRKEGTAHASTSESARAKYVPWGDWAGWERVDVSQDNHQNVRRLATAAASLLPVRGFPTLVIVLQAPAPLPTLFPASSRTSGCVALACFINMCVHDDALMLDLSSWANIIAEWRKHFIVEDAMLELDMTTMTPAPHGTAT
jgi:hypothetical protein